MYQNKIEALIDKNLLDVLYQEIVVLETCLNGLCSIIQEYDKEIHNEISLAIYVQMRRVKDIFNQLNQNN